MDANTRQLYPLFSTTASELESIDQMAVPDKWNEGSAIRKALKFAEYNRILVHIQITSLSF